METKIKFERGIDELLKTLIIGSQHLYGIKNIKKATEIWFKNLK